MCVLVCARVGFFWTKGHIARASQHVGRCRRQHRGRGASYPPPTFALRVQRLPAPTPPACPAPPRQWPWGGPDVAWAEGVGAAPAEPPAERKPPSAEMFRGDPAPPCRRSNPADKVGDKSLDGRFFKKNQNFGSFRFFFSCSVFFFAVPSRC